MVLRAVFFISMPDIIYSDNHLLCLDKPGGLLSQPSGTSRDSLESQGREWIRQQTGKTGNIFLEAVHRIDAAACGVVLFARTSKALSRLNAAVREGRCSKEYRVLVEGRMKVHRAELRNMMLHCGHHAEIVRPGTSGAKEAHLEYEVLEEDGGCSLLKVMLGSGRYHQIRAQLSFAGHPVVGDVRYGSKLRYRGNGAIALQHYCLTLAHPVGGAEMIFQSQIGLV